MIEIEEDTFIAPAMVTMVKASGKRKALLYFVGQSALEGFVVNRNALELAQEIVDALRGGEADEDEPDENPDEDQEEA